MWEVGSVIAYLHDIGDIPVNIVKIMAETAYSGATAVVFIIHMIVWGYTRCYVLPMIIYSIYKADLWEGTWLKNIFIYLLSCLVLLHYFWFGMFILALKRYAKFGDTADPRDKLKKK
jgi:hypothetical protein